MIYAKNSKDRYYIRHGKKIFDCISSFIMICLLVPIYAFFTILIKVDSEGPVFFSHERVGKGFKKFKLLKFRTMVKDASNLGPSITYEDDKRITKIGKFLRRYKIDELPQIFNVLKGDISIVGPRPEVKNYVDYYLRDYEEILEIKPGITDYAALKFRNEESLLHKEDQYTREILPVKISLYKKYIKEIGFLTDVKIIFETFIKIIK